MPYIRVKNKAHFHLLDDRSSAQKDTEVLDNEYEYNFFVDDD